MRMSVAMLIVATVALQVTAGVATAAELASGTRPRSLLEHHDTLPIPDFTYGNPAGCLMLLDNQPDIDALWLTPSEIGGTIFECRIGQWSQEGNIISAKCGDRKFWIILRSETVPSVVVMDITGEQPYPAYVLTSCQIEE
jgi:hypothetical protein